MHISQLLQPEPALCKSPDINPISATLVQAGGEILTFCDPQHYLCY